MVCLKGFRCSVILCICFYWGVIALQHCCFQAYSVMIWYVRMSQNDHNMSSYRPSPCVFAAFFFSRDELLRSSLLATCKYTVQCELWPPCWPLTGSSSLLTLSARFARLPLLPLAATDRLLLSVRESSCTRQVKPGCVRNWGDNSDGSMRSHSLFPKEIPSCRRNLDFTDGFVWFFK